MDHKVGNPRVTTANGYRTLRFWNHGVLRSRDAVADTLFAALSSDLAS